MFTCKITILRILITEILVRMSVIENTSSELEPNKVILTNDESVEKTETTSEITEAASEAPTSEETVLNSDTAATETSVETKKEAPKVEIPVEDYTVMDQETLLASLQKLTKAYPVHLIKDQVEVIRKQFNINFDAKAAASKETFLAEGGNEIDFHYSTPLKRDFNEAYFEYKDARNQHYQALKTNQENNLKNRLQLIEDLKALIASDTSVNKKFDTFNDLKEQWHQAGSIPRDKNNVVWNTFYHHVDKFYEVVHLDREFRDMDYKHNLEQKIKILERAKELTEETSINRAFRELQVLHKIWKEEIGPVAREYKDLVWDKFSEFTKEIHDKRQQYFAEQDVKQEENLVIRKDIIAQINALTEVPRTSHNQWQNAVKEVGELHEAFKKSGRVPNEVKNSIWDEFRTAERSFNAAKNEFYKHAKSDQLENLHKKKALIELAEANKDSEDFEATTQLMKKIQSDWKKIGHVPRKDSDKVWKQFKDACNHYFERISGLKDEANKLQEEAFEKKTAFIESVKDAVITDVEFITTKISEWKTLGAVPYNKRKIEEQFSTLLDSMFGQLNMNKKESELMKYETRLADLASQNDDRLLNDEKIFVRKKMDEVKAEILQLENNLQFFKHADKSNPLVADVYKKIDKHNDDLAIWKAKWIKLKSL